MEVQIQLYLQKVEVVVSKGDGDEMKDIIIQWNQVGIEFPEVEIDEKLVSEKEEKKFGLKFGFENCREAATLALLTLANTLPKLLNEEDWFSFRFFC